MTSLAQTRRFEGGVKMSTKRVRISARAGSDGPLRTSRSIVKKLRFNTTVASCAGVVTLAAMLLLTSLPAYAWKPTVHVYTGNEAISEILNGQNQVTVFGRVYPVAPEIAEAIRNYPDFYRGGCVGPDGFPDLLFGQTIIHPDWKADGGTYTYEWLAHIYSSAWSYYSDRGGDASGQQALAFMYGYLNHAGGDLWGHTLINYYAGGAWPEIPGGDISIAVRHVIVEEYISQFTPPTNLSINWPNGFIHDTFISSETAKSLSKESSIPFGIPYFVKLRAKLVAERNSLECSPLPWDWVGCAMILYIDAWIEDIDSGLDAWPNAMGRVSRELTVNSDFPEAKSILEQFMYDHLLSMYGSPDFVGGFLDLWDGLMDWISGLINVDIPGIGDLLVYLIESRYGISFDELKDYFENPANYINSPPLFGPNTSALLDGVMHPSGGQFDPELFSACKNTIVTAKMILMGPAALNDMLADFNLLPLYGGENTLLPVGMRQNVMLGFIRTLDGDHQWRRFPIGNLAVQHSEGMPLWVDCASREKAFRVLFDDWEYDRFPDFGEECICYNDYPPTITVDMNRDCLWPPNHKLCDIAASVTVKDDCCDTPTFKLISITSNEPDDGKGDGNTIDDIQYATIGIPDTLFQLRSERSGRGDGRVYTIIYEAKDCSGNTALDTACVRVPHDQGGEGITHSSTGFRPDGTSFEPGADRFALIVSSHSAADIQADPDVRSGGGATDIDLSRAYVGNTKGVALPVAVRALDSNGDGQSDLILYYSVDAVQALTAARASNDGAIELNSVPELIGFHYTTADGTDYLVRNIFALGSPVFIAPNDVVPGKGKPDPERRGELEPPGSVPRATMLLNAHPNPFNPTTMIPYCLASSERVTLRIFDAQGKLVRTLAEGEKPAGSYEVAWNGRDDSGRSVATGMYFVQLQAGSYEATKKLLMIR